MYKTVTLMTTNSIESAFLQSHITFNSKQLNRLTSKKLCLTPSPGLKHNLFLILDGYLNASKCQLLFPKPYSDMSSIVWGAR